MKPDEHLFICGASTRAAAFSALRAGLKPWCADLFADADLQARCPAVAIRREDYPEGFVSIAQKQAPRGPWMFTGGIENHPSVVHQIQDRRRLWGSNPILTVIRHPLMLARDLCAVGLPVPEISWYPDDIPDDGSWLLKPIAGSGGAGIVPWRGQPLHPDDIGRTVYFQKRVDGMPCSAVYLGNGEDARLVGVTRQLVGERWLHARRFAYCGSIGPLHLSPIQWSHFLTLGGILGREWGIHGLFGVDCVLQDDVPWTIELNPRYTASVEVHEYAQRTALLRWYPALFPRKLKHVPRETPGIPRTGLPPPDHFVGKAILFARDTFAFPSQGPWSRTLGEPGSIWDLPAFADIPHAGATIRVRQPILTFFARGHSEQDCLDQLRGIAGDLDRRLYR